MRYILFLIIAVTLLNIACSKRDVSIVKLPQEDCSALKKGPVKEPLLSVNHFRKELAEFTGDTEIDYQILYIFSPGDDSYGSLLYCKIDGDSASIVRGTGGTKTTRKYGGGEVKELLGSAEHGGFYLFCNDLNRNHYYLAMIKHRDSVIFQYQSMNSDLLTTKSESMKNSINLYRYLRSE